MDLQDTANGEGGSLSQTQEYGAAGAEVLAAFEGAGGVSGPHGSDPFATSLGSLPDLVLVLSPFCFCCLPVTRI
jgi:hypothetical protein